jgi:hypothetical protein
MLSEKIGTPNPEIAQIQSGIITLQTGIRVMLESILSLDSHIPFNKVLKPASHLGAEIEITWKIVHVQIRMPYPKAGLQKGDPSLS